MSWIQKLYETYEQTVRIHTEEKTQPWPVAHFSKRAHVEIVIDESGQLRRIKKLAATESATLIPVTEASLGRAGSKIAPHPLCEETSYCAIDFPDGNKKKQTAYLSNLEKWCQSDQAHPKAKAVLAYLKRATLWTDLLREKMIPLVVEGARSKEKISDEKIFVRWRVEASDSLISATWEDAELIESWAKYDEINNPKNGMCMVLGEEARIGNNHPKFIRNAGDGAKLISANDSSGFTFRGRFTDTTGQQACGVSYEVTQKAHNVLRWLIQRQGHKYGDPKQPQVVITWAVGGAPIPDPFGSTLTLLLDGVNTTDSPTVIVDSDAGQTFAKRLNLMMRGYHARLGTTDDIVVMGLDSATPGRMAITFYRELTGSEYLARIERWHTDFAWHQNFSKDKHFVGAPAPRDIAEAAYATRIGTTGELRVDEKFLKTVVERLLPCIVDEQPIPKDIVSCVIRKASNRVGLKHWEWEKFLGIACGLYRGAFKNEGYEMALETDRRSRDYLYGRLLALAENIEGYALISAENGRETTAARFMQRFADRPVSTWRTIELALSPYKSRLNASAKGKGFLIKRMRVIDEILCLFEPEDFLLDTKLSGEFLLGYHCQRQTLNPPKAEATAANDDDTPAE